MLEKYLFQKVLQEMHLLLRPTHIAAMQETSISIISVVC